jgi:phage-related holin
MYLSLTIKKKMNVDSNKDFFGFENMSDFLTSLLGTKSALINLAGATIAATSSFITNYMWDSYQAVYVLWLLMALDWGTGLFYAMKSKTYWSRKNFRMPIYYVATSLLLSISWWLAKSSVFFFPLPSLVYGGFCAVYLTSLLENAGKLGWIPEPIAKAIGNRFGIKEILKKYDNKEKVEKDN